MGATTATGYATYFFMFTLTALLIAPFFADVLKDGDIESKFRFAVVFCLIMIIVGIFL